MVPCEVYLKKVQAVLQQFYQNNPQIGPSHGLSHAMAVHDHAVKAIESHNKHALKGKSSKTMLSDMMAMEIRVASMLHDVDDDKFFPKKESNGNGNCLPDQFPNATSISQSANIPPDSIKRILQMISWTGCTKNGNTVPIEVQETNQYHLLIPRWSDRLEAVGRIGVVRCYQYNREIGAPLWKDNDLYDSPRPTSEDEVWSLYATPERFQNYLSASGGGKGSSSMISHYYDKLLHIARPPPDIVRNEYLETMARESSKELVEICLRFGKTGVVDEEYILSLKENFP